MGNKITQQMLNECGKYFYKAWTVFFLRYMEKYNSESAVVRENAEVDLIVYSDLVYDSLPFQKQKVFIEAGGNIMGKLNNLNCFPQLDLCEVAENFYKVFQQWCKVVASSDEEAKLFMLQKSGYDYNQITNEDRNLYEEMVLKVFDLKVEK